MAEENKKKIIVVGAKEKVSPEILDNLKEHYNCEIEIVSREEFKAKYMEEFLNVVLEQEKQEIELCFKRMNLDYLPLEIGHSEREKPYCPKKTGKVNNKKLSSQRRWQGRKRAR